MIKDKSLAKHAPAPGAVVATTQYLPIRPGQERYTLLMRLALEWGCPWQDIAREAIDRYLLQQFPPKK